MSHDKQIGYEEPEEAVVRQGYEHSYVSQGAILVLLAGFVVCFAAILGGLWWLHERELHQVSHNQRRSAIDTPPSTDAPPLQPQVGHEAIDAWDLKKMRDQEDQTFQQLGWTQDEAGRRFTVPATLIDSLRQKQAATQPGER